MLVIWDTEHLPKALYFKPENEEDDRTLEGMKYAWECYERHRKEFNGKNNENK